MSFGMELFCSGLYCVDENVRVYLIVYRIKECNIEKKNLNWSLILGFDCKWKGNPSNPSRRDDYCQTLAIINRVNTVKWSVNFIFATLPLKMLQWPSTISWKTPNTWVDLYQHLGVNCFSSEGRSSFRQTWVQIPPSLTSQLCNPWQFPYLPKPVSLSKKYWGKNSHSLSGIWFWKVSYDKA